MNPFKEYYAISELSEKDQKKYWLIQRYKIKVSDRLRREADGLFLSGSNKSSERMAALVAESNPLFKMLDRHGFYWGVHMPIPKYAAS